MRTSACACAFLLALLALPSSADDASDSRQRGREVMLRMATYLASLEHFSVRVRGGYDAVQDDGRKVQFLETRAITMARPNQLRAEETRSDGRNNLVLFDGARITVVDGDARVFAQAEQPGGVDDSIIYFLHDLQMRLPLAPLLTTHFPAELAEHLKFADYVETSYAFDAPADQVVGSTSTVDFQFWIAQGDKPLPLRIVMTYKNDPGQPQFWADFVDWNVKPRIAKNFFVFKPPGDAHQIVFAVQLIGPPQASEPTPIEGEAP
jgi:hypothetical protein